MHRRFGWLHGLVAVVISGRGKGAFQERSGLLVLIVLFLALLYEFRETILGGFLYASLVTGGAGFLIAQTLMAVDTFAPRLARLWPWRIVPSFWSWQVGSRRRPEKSGLVYWAISTTVLLAVALAMLPVFLNDLPLWESFLAGAGVGGFAGLAIMLVIGIFLSRAGKVDRGITMESDSPAIPSGRSRWLTRIEKVLYWLLVATATLFLVRMTAVYDLPVWPTFVVVVAIAGLLSIVWHWLINELPGRRDRV